MKSTGLTVVWLGLAVWLLAAVLPGPGCAASRRAGSGPRPGSGLAEYRQITANAEQGLGRAIASLATVSAQFNRCRPEVLTAFSAELQELQVGSLRLRARAQAIQARGDAYFQSWQENLARIADPQVRALAEKERPALQAGFQRVKQLSTEAREAFRAFLYELRTVRNSLEKDPASLKAAGTQEMMATARQHGEQVERCLVGIRIELDAMTARLTPPGRAAQNPGTG